MHTDEEGQEKARTGDVLKLNKAHTTDLRSRKRKRVDEEAEEHEDAKENDVSVLVGQTVDQPGSDSDESFSDEEGLSDEEAANDDGQSNLAA